jgi:tape measure domain-containing protein
MGARADIYMHANALSSLVQSGKGMLDVYANFKAASAGIEVFTRDAAKANAVMGDLMQYAQQTPYSMAGIAEETKNMMGRGVAVDMATDAIKRLGVVAGGSQERLSRLSLVFSQIMTKGKLMQQDLNQLAEHGFNPLVTMARASLKPGFTDDELKQRIKEITLAKEQGLVTSEHFAKALEVETSKGGYFADLLNRMSKEVGGLTSRLSEMFLEMKLSVMDVLDARLKDALKTAIVYVKMLQDWIKNNREAAARIVDFIVKVVAFIAAFHMLGLAVASVRWWLHSAVSVLYGLRVVLTPVIVLFQSMAYVAQYAGVVFAGALRMVTVMTQIYNTVTLMMDRAIAAAYRGMVYFTTSILGNARALAINTIAMLRNSAVGRFLALSYQTIRSVGLLEYFRQLAVVVALSTFAMLQNAATGLMGAVRTGGAIGLLMRMMNGFRLVSIFAWMSFLGPIPLIVGGIGLVVAGIFAVMNALQGAGGISGAITKIWETMQWFAQAAYGFFYNFAENAGIIAKYVYENWRSMFSDLGKILGGFFMAVPGNILVMWRMGLRLTVAFGTWLIDYLPKAIKNAFSAAMEFVKDVFMRILDAGKRVWKFITSPSEWGKGTKAITSFMDTLSGDVAKTREDGFFEAAKTIINEETGKIKTGLEGVEFSSPEMNLNLKVPEAQKPPEPPELAIPEAPTDAAAMFAAIQPDAKGTKTGTKGSDYKVQDAMSVHSGDYTKKMAEYMDRMRGMKAATSDPKLQAQNKANQILQRIEKNTQQKPMEVAELDL